MSSLIELLKDFSGAIAVATSQAPDEYVLDFMNFKLHKEDILSLWSQIRPRLKHNLDEAEIIDAKLKLGLDAYERGENDVGRKAMFDIYNLEIKKLR